MNATKKTGTEMAREMFATLLGLGATEEQAASAVRAAFAHLALALDDGLGEVRVANLALWAVLGR
jgi:hypothetical protein